MAARELWKPCEGEDWLRLWKIQAPPKAKHLLWRICKECLPTRTRLVTRYVQCPVECPLCGSAPENEWHLFFECAESHGAWIEAGVQNYLPNHSNAIHNTVDFLFSMCRQANNHMMGKIAMLLWCIWKNRNNEVWNNNKVSARQIGQQATHMWTEWATVQGLISHDQRQEQQLLPNTNQTWQQPPWGFVKCNVDASFFNTESATGWGWCVRDHAGRYILAGTEIRQSNLTILEGEAMALIAAMEQMVQRGFSKVIFESDSKIIVDAICSTHVGISELSVLLSHIKSLLLSNPNFEVKFIRRQANMVAHLLAREVYSIASCRVFESIPPCIATQLFNDMN